MERPRPAPWARFTGHLRREIAHAAGLTQRALRHHATLSYAKVAEYQKRGQIHFHTVIRIPGWHRGDRHRHHGHQREHHLVRQAGPRLTSPAPVRPAS
ncbi:replication initiator [Streptomyces sp. NPDC101455]|uniref:replication initiator n=1 Tax=Streptomyces sp. NPDC101455 TaxID=3366142 RepID=UPI0037F53179